MGWWKLSESGNFSQNNNASLLTLNATGGTKIFDPGTNTATYPFRGILINAPSTTYNVANNFIINQNQDFTVNAGYFNLNAHTLQLNTNAQKIVVNGGTFDVNAGSVLTFNGVGQQLINNGGIIRFVGTPTAIAIINRLGTTSTYTITQNSGVIHASNYKFDNLNGITIVGGTIDATDNFSDGTFSSGGGTAYLTLTGLSFSNFTANNVVFNTGPTYNVARTSGLGSVTFADASGSLAGELHDNDAPGDTLVKWSATGGGYYWVGTISNDWNVAGNWFNGKVPDNSSIVYLNHKYALPASNPYTVKITSADAFAGRVTIDAEAAGAVTLQLEGGYKLDVNGSLVINASSTLNVTNPSCTINVAGNWSNAGTFNHGNSTVTFDGTNGYFTLATGGNAVGKKFYNFNINATGATYALSAAIGIDNSININAGTLDMASSVNNMSVGGNWFINNLNGATILPN